MATETIHPLEIRLLGAIEITVSQAPAEAENVPIGGRIQRRILAALLAARPDVVSIDRLVDITWSDEPPARAEHNIRTYISRLRNVLGTEAALEQVGDGYRITLADAGCDVDRFDELVDAAERLRTAGSAGDALEAIRRAGVLWRGQPFGEFAFEPWAQAEVARLDERHNSAREIHAELLLSVGRPADAVRRLQAMVAEHPLRERPRALLMRALYADGRTTEALREFHDFRTHLRDDVGLDPSPGLIELDHSIARGELIDQSVSVKVAGYELHERIGAGAFAVVHRATQTALGREVAIKIIRAELATQPAFVRGFEREARVVARLEHDAVVPLYDFWRDPDQAYLVMRYLPGGSLAERLKTGPLPLDEVQPLVERIGSALAAAHVAGVVHRDVKPANILFDADGRAVLGDFGIAVDQGVSVGGAGARASESSARFAAPEQLRGEQPGPSADVYSLALVVWSALAGRVPFASSLSDAVVSDKASGTVALESIATLRPDLPLTLVEAIDAATNPDPALRPRSITELVERIRAVIEATGSESSARRSGALPIEPSVNPFQGLRSFDEATARHFHGRGDLIDELVEVFGDPDQRLLTVVGASGSGKSSVVRAGLLPALRSGAVEGSDTWFVTSMTPGARPFESLETAALRVAVNPPGELLTQLTSGDRGLARAVERLLPERDGCLLLVIDQFEELFTNTDPATADQFLDALATAITEPGGRLRVVATLRGDFYDRPLRHPLFAPLLKAATVAVTPLSPQELEAVIVEPARSVGADFETGLVARIMSDSANQPGSLALLEYALTQAFDHSDRQTITTADYDSIGGLKGALVTQAEGLHDQLDTGGRAALRRVMESMVALGEGTEDTRRRVLRSELGASNEVDDVIDAFSAARLFTLDHDPSTREPTVEVAHETLIRSWPRLRQWLDEDRDDLRLARHLATAAQYWDATGRPESELYRGGRLEAATDWRARSDLELPADTQQFLNQSLAQAEAVGRAEQDRLEFEQQSNRRLRRLLAGVGVLLAFALVASGIAFQQRRSAQETAYDAETSRLVATAQALADTNPRAALLLALTAHQREQTPETLGALQVALTRAGPNLGTLGEGTQYVDVAWLDNDFVVGARIDGLDLFEPGTLELVDTVALNFGDFGPHRLASVPGGAVVVAHEGVQVTVFTAFGRFEEERRLPDSAFPVVAIGVGPELQTVTAALDGTVTSFSVDGTVGFVRHFNLPESMADQSEELLDFNEIYRAIFQQIPVSITPFPLEEGVLLTIGAELHRLDWAGSPIGSETTVVFEVPQPGGSTVRLPAPAPVDLQATDGQIVALGLTSVLDFEWKDSWNDYTTAAVLGSTLGGGQSHALEILGRTKQGVRILSSGGIVNNFDLAGHDETFSSELPVVDARAATTSPDGSVLAAIAGDGIQLTSLLDGAPIATVLDRWETSSSVSISPDGRTVAMGPSGSFGPFDVRSRATSGHFASVELPDTGGPLVGIDPGDAVLRAITQDATVVALYALDGGSIEEIARWDPAPEGEAGAPSPDGSLLAIGTTEISVWETEGTEPIMTLPSPGTEGTPVVGVRFDPSGTRLLTTWANGRSQLVEVGTWEPLNPASLAEADVVLAYWNLDGSLIATAATDGTITVRDGTTFEPIRSMVGASGVGDTYDNVAMLFSPDNRHLLTNLRGPGRLWDVETGQQIGQPFPNLKVVNPGMNVGEVGLQLITGSERGALIWNLDTDSWPEIACRTAGSNLSEDEWVQWGPRDEPYRDVCL